MVDVCDAWQSASVHLSQCSSRFELAEARVQTGGVLDTPADLLYKRFERSKNVRAASRAYLVALALVGAVCVNAQSPSPAPPAFDAASIRVNKVGGSSGVRPLPTGQFTATNVTAFELIRRAWAVHPSQIIGRARWINEERFDVLARSAQRPAGGVPVTLLMVQRLLEDRFKLRVRRETRDLSAYALVLRRSDGRLGPGLRQAERDCTANAAPPTPNTAPLGADGWPPCGLQYMLTLTGDGSKPHRTNVRMSAMSMDDLAERLQNVADRTVVNLTELPGTFDIEYEYASQAGTPLTASATSPADAVDFFTAVEEQLGLKLDARRLLVPVLVVDSIERPSEN